jgi:hypothetical protein
MSAGGVLEVETRWHSSQAVRSCCSKGQESLRKVIHNKTTNTINVALAGLPLYKRWLTVDGYSYQISVRLAAFKLA